MSSEIVMLLWAASSIAFIHTLMGPDHYLPFVAIGKARGWRLSRVMGVTILCGIGHSIGSILLGILGVYGSMALGDMALIESARGDVAAWVLVAFGLIYLVWGIKRSHRQKSHQHFHTHSDGTGHTHHHNHARRHAHIHEAKAKGGMGFFTPWALFIIFVLGPCEPLIPLMMIPVAQGEWLGLMLTVGVFTAVTVTTMTAIVLAATLGLKSFSFAGFEKYGHAIAGGTLSLCGLGMIGLGI